MLLDDLKTHAPEQQLKIDRLIGYGGFFSDSLPLNLADWDAFRESLWGKALPIAEPQEPAKGDDKVLPDGEDVSDGGDVSDDGDVSDGGDVSDDGDVSDGELLPDNDSLPEAAPAPRPVIEIPEAIADAWNPDSDRILVRSEYEEAERGALSANADNIQVFMVTGQPGIGKSVFLMWLLMRRLALELPTALQVEKDHAILFHGRGTSRFLLHDSSFSYMRLKFPPHDSGRIWALVDSNQDLFEPAPVFRKGKPFFVVEAASPRLPRLEWVKKVISRSFYMKTWDLSEILQARPFLGLLSGGPYEEGQLRYLYETYGATPRALCRYAHQPDEYRRLVAAQVRLMDPPVLRSTLQRPECQDSSHLITTIEPSPISRSDCEKTVASQGVLELLWNTHLKDQVSEMKRFYDLFRSSPVSASAAGWVFELRMHQLLRQGNSIQLFPVGRRGSASKLNYFYCNYTASEQGKDQKVFQLSASEEHLLNEEVQLRVGHYYRPQTSNFPTIDSLFLVHPPGGPSPILLMFQMTRNKKEHDVNEGGLCRIEAMDLPRNTRKYYVLVTPRDIQPKIKAPKVYLKAGRKSRKFDKDFQVFHLPVDPDTLFSR